ncbi:alpha/beta hydrolase [Fulvivirga sedimenti]|uniref:Alpha/beta hydrolase n=1 Tax=Fulvivirga sedimenti TaxID=2879465 RepID=A0A9X1HUT6_9BACT|nr:alpha/beta hydrolase [Fulvivirga sedimenti]MCA6074897.1 alpha/beta hydrolase [Fulvivirga sedimenti]MCA6076074.1 alpha/beta hydrolase [Fulvivirga sedimenti]MCA6077202.1 alpha/beta hydrolase [Fulvivirga sedimenti]
MIIRTLVLFFCSLPCFLLAQSREFNDLPYINGLPAEDSLRRLNLVIPQNVKSPAPLLIWIGGGAWSYVDRNVEMDLARKIAEEGIAVASIGHRLSPATWRDPSLNSGIQHPAHMQDLAAAVKWLYDHARTYGIDKSNIFIGGFSSGAHLAALITMDPDYLKAAGLPSDLFRGVIPISGAFDLVDYYNALLNSDRPELAELHVQAVFGPNKQDLISASPVTYLDNLSIPMLLISDITVQNYTRLFEERIQQTDFRNIQVIYANTLTHAALWKNMSYEEESPYRNYVIDFIRQNYRDHPTSIAK